MGLLSSILGNKKDNVRLVSVVEKKENSEHELFVNINNDLALYIEKVGLGEDPLRKMAYAYARRLVAGGMYMQGLIDRDLYDHVCTIFRGFQQSTGQTKEFQIEANEQAVELLLSYSTKLNRDVMLVIHKMAFEGVIDSPSKQGQTYTVDHLLYGAEKMKSMILG